jgi:uroporphyrinogen-III synthase
MNAAQTKNLLLLRAVLDLDALALSAQQKTALQQKLQQSPLEDALKKNNFQTSVLNSTVIKPSDEFKKIGQALSVDKNRFSDQEAPEIIIVVSKHAALLARLVLPDSWFQQAQVLSVGKAAIAFFEDKITVSCASPENGEGLMKLAALQNINNTNVLICKGEQGLDFIENECKQRGARVKVVNLYTRTQASVEKLLQEMPKVENIDYLFATSVYVLEHFNNAVSKDKSLQEIILKKTVLVLSERIADQAKKAGFSSVEVYEGSNE